LINCDIRGDFWGGVVKREPWVMYIHVFTTVNAHIESFMCVDFRALLYMSMKMIM